MKSATDSFGIETSDGAERSSLSTPFCLTLRRELRRSGRGAQGDGVDAEAQRCELKIVAYHETALSSNPPRWEVSAFSQHPFLSSHLRNNFATRIRSLMSALRIRTLHLHRIVKAPSKGDYDGGGYGARVPDIYDLLYASDKRMDFSLWPPTSLCSRKKHLDAVTCSQSHPFIPPISVSASSMLFRPSSKVEVSSACHIIELQRADSCDRSRSAESKKGNIPNSSALRR